MSTSQTALDYYDGDTLCKGVVYAPQHSSGPLPVVLVTHAWDGTMRLSDVDSAEGLVSATWAMLGARASDGRVAFVTNDQVGIATDRHAALARIDVEDLCRISHCRVI